jgi:tripartite-type tricarboxylate transporter receptor subunit TctC
VASLSEPELKARLDGMGAFISGGTPEQFGAFMNSEIARWAKVVKESKAVQD